jgi:Skp family chaperone for outer membrane proteins
MKVKFLMLTMVLGSLLFVQCNQPRDNKTGESSGNYDTESERNDMMDREREEVAQNLREVRDDIDRELEEISNDMENASDEARRDLEETRKDLTDRRSRVEETLDEVQNATADTWDDIKDGANNTIEDRLDQ